MFYSIIIHNFASKFIKYSLVSMEETGRKIKGQVALAKYLGVSQPTISEWHKAGKFEGCFFRIGRVITYDLDAIEKKFKG